jgi:hypothetical protein
MRLHAQLLSLLRIPFESEFELRRELPLELMRSNETGCDPNHKRLTLIEIEKPCDT